MLSFYLRRALRNLRRTPVLSSVMVIDMALGIAIWVTSYASVKSHTRDPLADSSAIFHVDWGTAPDVELGPEGYSRVLSMAPHVMLSYRDARRLADHPAVARSASTFTSRLTVGTTRGRQETSVRFCTRELFGDVRAGVRYGGAWSASDERALAPVLVLDHATNQALFAGQNSVGRTLDIDGQAFRVAGVLADMSTRVRGFDFTFTSPAGAVPALRAVRAARRAAGLHRAPTRSTARRCRSWRRPTSVRAAVGRAAQRGAARGVQRVRRRRRAGTHPAPRVKRPMLVPLAAWLEHNVAIPNGFFMFHACAFLALLACSVNLSRLLLVKFQGRAQELAVQRALGATRLSVFSQHMLEVVVVTLAATLLALLVAWISLIGINAIVPDRPSEFALDGAGLAIGCAVGLGSACSPASTRRVPHVPHGARGVPEAAMMRASFSQIVSSMRHRRLAYLSLAAEVALGSTVVTYMLALGAALSRIRSIHRHRRGARLHRRVRAAAARSADVRRQRELAELRALPGVRRRGVDRAAAVRRGASCPRGRRRRTGRA